MRRPPVRVVQAPISACADPKSSVDTSRRFIEHPDNQEGRASTIRATRRNAHQRAKLLDQARIQSLQIENRTPSHLYIVSSSQSEEAATVSPANGVTFSGDGRPRKCSPSCSVICLSLSSTAPQVTDDVKSCCKKMLIDQNRAQGATDELRCTRSLTVEIGLSALT